MALPICEEEGPLREWAPESRLLQQIPLKAQKGLFSYDLNLTCLDVVSEYIAVGTNCGLVYWYCRETGELQRLRFENTNASISCIKVVSTVDYMVAAGSEQGTITVFQIPKKPPDSIPDELKPKNKSVERFTIDGLHCSKITAIEWSQNGMKLFSGDKNGAVVLTEIDFYMHLSKSTELLNEQFEIVQLSYSQQTLVVSTLFRSIICDGNDRWKVHQIGTKERKTLGKFGATFCKFDHGSVIYASRLGHRLWLADKFGRVEQTLIFKPTVTSTYPKIQLLNPFNKIEICDSNFGKLIQFKDGRIIAYNAEMLYVLHLGAISIVSSLDCARKILDVAVNEDEIYILEGERSLLRISQVPDRYSLIGLENSIFGRRSSFTFDDLASRIKDTAVGSIKKITTDFIVGQDQNSPPALADEAMELPPIVDLPAGSVPDITAENKSSKKTVRKNFSQTSPEKTRIDVFEENGKSFSTELVARPIRRRNPRRNKNVLIAQGQESESDTTSTASEDRMAWGTTNDLSASEESQSIALSQSSFSVLKDVGCLLPSAAKPSTSEACQSEDEASRIPEDRSPESVDTCESVSERLVLTPEKFLEEQEKILSRFAEREVSLLDGLNSEKTDDMSVSFNATPSSSVSSKTSENFHSNNETSENASMISEAKTDESLNCENFKNDLPLPKNLCFYRPNDKFLHPGRKRESVTESSASDGSSVKSFDPTERLKTGRLEEKRADYLPDFKSPEVIQREVENKEMILSQLLGMDLASLDIGPSVSKEKNGESPKKYDWRDEEKTDTSEAGASAITPTKFHPEIMESDLCKGDYVKNVHYSRISDYESFLPEPKVDTIDAPEKDDLLYRMDERKFERKNSDLEDKKLSSLSSLDPLSYGPPSGSSMVSNSRPSMEYAPGAVYDPSRLQLEFEERSDRWLQYKCPEPVTSLSVCDTYVVCTDINEQVYYSELSGLGLSWILLDYKASLVDVSDDAGIVWILYKKTIFGLVDPSKKGPFSDMKMEGAGNVRSFAIDKMNREGWIAKLDGQIKCQKNLVRAPCGKTDDVSCQWLVTSVACRNNCVMAITSDEGVICKPKGELGFKPVKTPCPVTVSIALGPENLAWIVDDRCNIFFSDDFQTEHPHWWQILISDYIFQHSPSVFQNMHSKIRLNNLRANIQLKNTMVAADERSVWIFDKFSTVIHVNKSDFTGYIWDKLSVTLPSLKWDTLRAEGVFEDKGHLWLLSTNGDLFCTKPNARYFQSIPSPCADRAVCIASSTDTLWVLYSDGKIYSRLGLTEENLTGNSWRELDLPRTSDIELSWISCGCDVAWGCDSSGRTFVAVGSPHRMSTDVFDAAWVEVEDKPKEGVRFEKVFVGPQIYMVWAVDSRKNIYVREGIFPNFQIGTGWVYVAGIEAVHLTVSGTSVWALSVNGSIYRRHGISENNYIGDYWKRIPGNLRVLTSSFNDELWGISSEGTVLRLKKKTIFLSGKKDARARNDTRSSGEDGDWEVVE